MLVPYQVLEVVVPCFWAVELLFVRSVSRIVASCIFHVVGGNRPQTRLDISELFDIEWYHDLEILVRGHSASLKPVPFESLGAVSDRTPTPPRHNNFLIGSGHFPRPGQIWVGGMHPGKARHKDRHKTLIRGPFFLLLWTFLQIRYVWECLGLLCGTFSPWTKNP